MNLLRQILHDLALVVLVTAGVLACLVLWKALGMVEAVNVTMATVNAPCKDNGHQVVCGTLAQVGQTTKNAGIMAALTAEQVKQSGTLITATTQNMDKVAASVTGEVADLQDTTKAVTITAQTASTSLQTITDGITPVLASTKNTVDGVGTAVGSVSTAAKGLLPLESDADAAVKGLLPIEANTAIVSGNLGQTTADFQTKFHVFLFPVPCKTFGCKVKRTWPYVKSGAEMVEPLYWGQQLFENRVP